MPRQSLGSVAASDQDFLKGDSGVVALEFALTAPVLLLLVLGTMAFAIQFGVLVGVIHAASEGARASIGGLGSGDRAQLANARVQQIFQSYGPLMNPDNVTVTTTDSAGTYAVKIDYRIDTLGLDKYTHFMIGGGQVSGGHIIYTAIVGDGGY
jgi:Flp pilus assembly protein TadG